MHLLRPLPVLLGLLWACNHQDPFPEGEPTPNGPRSSTPPVQLTFSPGEDRSPAWRNDGAAFFYSLASEESAPTDRCVAEMPTAGGTRSITKCLIATDTDTLRALGPAAAAMDGRLAWVDARSLVGRRVPDRESIRVGTPAARDTGTVVRDFPYPASSGVLHVTPTNLVWMSPTRLAYIANDRFLIGPCMACKPDTLIVAREAVILDLAATPATPQVVPNTGEITSLWPAADGQRFYFTRAGDPAVYLRQASGGDSLVHTFGAIARDVNVRGNRLTAVVGGKVSYGVDPIIGARQIDSGGALMLVDLGSGNESPVPLLDRVIRHPALSADGQTILVEAVDTLAPVWQADLWRLALP